MIVSVIGLKVRMKVQNHFADHLYSIPVKNTCAIPTGPIRSPSDPSGSLDTIRSTSVLDTVSLQSRKGGRATRTTQVNYRVDFFSADGEPLSCAWQC